MKDCPNCHSPNPDDAAVCRVCQSPFHSPLKHEDTRMDTEATEYLSAGEMIDGRYQVIGELGVGGMGVVYRVRDTKLRDREVALKMIRPELVAHPEARRRFKDEVITCLELDHPNIVRVYDLKEWEGRSYFTMEYIRGRSLRQMLDERRDTVPPFDAAGAVGIVGRVLEALGYAHQKTVHRDIKPENIMVVGEFPDIRVKVLDFGIAKAMSPSRFSRTAHALGTAYYMAPEQMAGKGEIDHRADLYAVGMVLYELLTGRMAVGFFRFPSEIVGNLSPVFDDVLKKALAPEPDERFADAASMKAALRDALSRQAGVKKTGDGERRDRKISRVPESSPADRRLLGKREQLGALLDRARGFVEAGDYDGAGDAVDRALALAPGNAEAVSLKTAVDGFNRGLRELLAEVKACEGAGRLAEGISLLETAEAPLKGHDQVRRARARLMAKLVAEEKRKLAEKARVKARVEQLVADGEKAMDRRQWKSAEAAFAEAARLAPKEGRIRAAQRSVAQKREELDRLESGLSRAEAAEDIDRVLELLEKMAPLVAEKFPLREKQGVWEEKRKMRQEKERRRVHLRTEPTTLSDDEIQTMLRRNNFYDRDWNPTGDFRNDFTDNGDGTVTDRATGLMWQKGGSSEWMDFDEARKYIADLNWRRFAGHADWRLPTLAELCSLLENKEKNGNLYIDPVFDRKQRWCWSADRRSSGSAWGVYFVFGHVDCHSLHLDNYVRAVRSWQ